MTLRFTARPTRSTGPGRARTWSVLVTLLVAVGLSVVPGSASAASTSVVPVADCYAPNSDGSYTVVLGYTNPTSSRVTIPAGTANRFNPTTYNSSLPTVFEPGTHHGAAVVTVRASDAGPNLSWYLDGTLLSTTSQVSTCSASQLPMMANGAVMVGLAVLAGLFGVVVVRRQRRTDGAELPGRG